MSDAVTNIEIEDVLSSIRRLVSDTDPSDAADMPLKHVEKAPDAHFLLTPALRISNDPKPDMPVESLANLAEDDAAAPLVLGPEDAVAARASLEATIAELEAAVTAQPDEWELDGSEVKTKVTWESAGFVSRASLAVVADKADAPEAETPDAVAPAPLELTDPVQDLADVEETLDAVDAAETAAISRIAFRRSGATPVDMDATDHGDELADIADPSMDPDAELETYLSGTPSIDDKLLRDLVQQVVREELQGHLGERITRNVRKLVRREIHRVLTSQDFD